jgi:hypothetical protein
MISEVNTGPSRLVADKGSRQETQPILHTDPVTSMQCSKVGNVGKFIPQGIVCHATVVLVEMGCV